MAETDVPARWARANEKAEGIADHGMDAPLRAYFRLWLPVGLVLLAGLGFMVSIVLLGNEPLHSQLAVGCIVAALATQIGGFAYVSRRIKPTVTLARSTPLYWLEESEQKAVHRQMLCKEPPVPEQLTVVRGAAVEARYAMTRQLVLLPGQFFFWAGITANLFPGASGLWLLLLIPALLLVVWASFDSVRRYRRMGAFLDDTRDAGQQAAARPD
jgi:hypothetical protein